MEANFRIATLQSTSAIKEGASVTKTQAAWFVKRVIYYRANSNEKEISEKWLNLLAKHSQNFLKGNGLEPTDELAKELGNAIPKHFVAAHPNLRHLKSLYRVLNCWERNEWPESETLSGKLQKAVKMVLGVIDGRFGRWTLKNPYRQYWQILTYGVTTILILTYVVIPSMNLWQRIVDFLNYVRWGI
jgi:hypothetical protein